MEEYVNQIADRYQSLSEDQKRLVLNLINSEQGQVVLYILGPEVATLAEELKRTAAPVEPEFLRG